MNILSKIYQRFTKKKRKNGTYEFTEEDVKHSAEIRKINAEIRKTQKLIELRAKQDELESLQEELGDFEEDDDEEINASSPDALLSSLLMKVLNTNQPPASNNTNPHTSQHTPSPDAGVSYSDEEIQDLMKGYSEKDLQELKKYSNEEIRTFIKNRYQLNDDTADRALVIIRK
jgi:hypothetical protein